MENLSTESNWLQEVLEQAHAKRWCTRPYCTTCGSRPFIRACVAGACSHSRVEVDFDANPAPMRTLDGLSSEESESVFRSFIVGLRGVQEGWAGQSGVRLILIHLNSPLIRWGVVACLDDLLEASPVGLELQRMRAHTEVRAEASRRHEERNSPENLAAIRAERQRKARLRQVEHQQRKDDIDSQRARVRQELEELTARERLVRIASLPPEFALDRVPWELIPRAAEVLTLDPEICRALLLRIRGHDGPWEEMRVHLTRLADQPTGPS